jgi:hypothetical protein
MASNERGLRHPSKTRLAHYFIGGECYGFSRLRKKASLR